MQRGRYIHLAALAGALALAAAGARPAHAAATPLTTPSQPILTPADGRVLVEFGGVLNAVGYNIYSHAAGSTPVLVNAQPTPYTWLIDDGAGKGLKNGTTLFYSVKAVTADSTGKTSEGPASVENATTVDPPIFGTLVAYNMNTPGTMLNPGTATYDKTKDLITLHASGDDVWDGSDGQTFLATAVTGDFTIIAKIPAPPTGGEPTYGKVGLEVRDALYPGARYGFLFASTHRDSPAEIMFEGRTAPEGGATFSGGTGGDTTAQKFPVWVKLARSGTMVSAQQSQDGKTWTDTFDAQDFMRLPPTLYVGIGATAHVDDPTMYLDGSIVASSLSITFARRLPAGSARNARISSAAGINPVASIETRRRNSRSEVRGVGATLAASSRESRKRSISLYTGLAAETAGITAAGRLFTSSRISS